MHAEQMTTLEKKIQHFSRILSTRPGDELTILALAEASFRRGLKLEALTAYQDVVGGRPVPEAHLAVAEIYSAQGMPHEAYGELRRLFALDPQNVEARLLINGLQEEVLPPEDLRAIMEHPTTEDAFDEARLRLKIQRTIYNRELQERTRNVTLEPGTVIHEYHMEEAKKKLIRVDELLRELERFREHNQTLGQEPPRPESLSAQPEVEDAEPQDLSVEELSDQDSTQAEVAPIVDELPEELLVAANDESQAPDDSFEVPDHEQPQTATGSLEIGSAPELTFDLGTPIESFSEADLEPEPQVDSEPFAASLETSHVEHQQTLGVESLDLAAARGDGLSDLPVSDFGAAPEVELDAVAIDNTAVDLTSDPLAKPESDEPELPQAGLLEPQQQEGTEEELDLDLPSAEREPSGLDMAPLAISVLEAPSHSNYATDFNLSMDSPVDPDLPDLGTDEPAAVSEEAETISTMVDLDPIEMGGQPEPPIESVPAVAPPTFDDAPAIPEPAALPAAVTVMPMDDDSTMILVAPTISEVPVAIHPPDAEPEPEPEPSIEEDAVEKPVYASTEVEVPQGLSPARKSFYETHAESLSALTTTLARTRGVTSIFLVAREGVTIDAVAKDDISEKRVGDLVRESFEFLEAFANDPAYWVLECAGGIFVMQKLDERHVLIAIGQAGANFGALRYTMDKTRTKFEQLLGQAPE